MYSYNHNDYSEDELYHHGVKGMKWGVRKKYRSAITKAGTAINNSRGKLHKKLTKHYENKAERYNKLSKKHGEKAKSFKEGSLRRRYNEQWEFNYKEQAKTLKKQSKMSLGKQLIGAVVMTPELAKTPYKRLVGRTTTIGRDAVESSFGLIVPVATLKDASYSLGLSKRR